MAYDEVSPELSEEELTRDQISMKAKKKTGRKKPRIFAKLKHKIDIYKKRHVGKQTLE